jgi:hypothetical protein
MTQTEINEIEARAKAATVGPWVTDLHKSRYSVYCGDLDHYHPIASIAYNQNQENNAKFIAHSRIDIIKCIDEIERLKEVIRSIQNGQQIEGGWN